MSADLLQLLRTPIALLWRHRVLTYEMARREIKDRYADQLLGSLWAFCHPVLLVALYVVVFKYVFKLGIKGAMAGQVDYTLYLLSGMIPWLAFQDSLNKTTSTLVANSRLVKQIVFPIEILPVKAVLASFVNQFICSTLLVLYAATTGGLTTMYFLLPILWFAQLLAMAGIGFVLSAVGAYFRDLRDIIQMFCTVGIYTMPICYTPDLVPESLRFVLYLNPFSYMVWCYQDVCFHGYVQFPLAWVVFLGGAVWLFYGGFYAFQRVKVFFGNVL